MYTRTNYKTKKALMEDFMAGKTIYTFQPGPHPAKQNGNIALEGPHYPKPHRWWAEAVIEDGIVTELEGKTQSKPEPIDEQEYAYSLPLTALEDAMNDGTIEAADGCIVEPDGKCQHGYSSPLVILGVI